jgi:2-polyprenyl-6-methoxyphenol hydroxylase-like FAD-dependent oxidoreductase
MPVSRRPTVLISGAGIAGTVAAYWLDRFGFAPTVVERSAAPRAGGGGHAVDLFGPALQVFDWMGLGAAIQQARTRTRTICLVRPGGREVAVSVEVASEGVSARHVEILRGDLATIAKTATPARVEYRFGDSISSVHRSPGGVDVTFETGVSRTFDIVLGADGLHSVTRRLVFGPDSAYLRYLGGCFAVFTAPNHLELDDRTVSFAAPGRTVAVYPVEDGRRARVLLLWRAGEPPGLHRPSSPDPRRLLRGTFGDLRWEVPRLLDAMDGADDLYLDVISQVIMPHWTRGRAALIGDAGYSPGAVVGGGTSLAVIGAYALASTLAEAGHDLDAGLVAYERALAPAVARSRDIGPRVIDLVMLRSEQRIWLAAQLMRTVQLLPPPARRFITAYGGAPAGMLRAARLTPPERIEATRTPR